jgi:ATP-binding cassette subfamily C protein
MRDLIAGIFATNRWRAAGALALAVGVGLTEGVAVLLLLPLLQLAGVEIQGGGSVSGISAFLGNAFNALGIRPTLVAVLLIYIAVTVLQATLNRAKSIVDTRVVQNYALDLRTRLYTAIARAEWLVLSRIRSSDFTFALTTAVDRAGSGAYNLLFFISTTAIALVYIGLAIRISPEMSGIILIVGGLLLVIERARMMGGRARGQDVTATTSDLYATAAEQLGGLKTAKSYGQEDRHLALFLDASRAVNRAGLTLTRMFASLRWRLTISSVVALSAILYLAVNAVHLATAAILLLLFIFSRLVPRLVSLQQTFQEILSALPALDTIERLVKQCEAAPERDDTARLPIVLERGISLEHVSFRYDEKTPPQLVDIDLTIPAGRTTAIVGPSGAGKSTLADLLLGLIRPFEGELLIGSVPLDRAHLHSWRSQIGYVAQDTFLFNDTVRANLEWARPGANDAEMLEALEHAAADEFVSRLHGGIDTVIGERGVRLSGGERQRLSLARALLRNPRVLILDEATSALDSENEERIYGAIQRLHGEMTIVVITHRLSTIRNADLIHVLDRGRLVASGSWNELVAGENARFRELCRAQGLLYEGAPV